MIRLQKVEVVYGHLRWPSILDTQLLQSVGAVQSLVAIGGSLAGTSLNIIALAMGYCPLPCSCTRGYTCHVCVLNVFCLHGVCDNLYVFGMDAKF